MSKNKTPFWTPWPMSPRFKASAVIERSDFTCGNSLHLCCTQLNETAAEKKRILNEWIDFFDTKPKLKNLRIGTRCPQVLFEAACRCSGLVSFDIHWGPIDDLKPIRNLGKLQRLGIGSCSVSDLKPIAKLTALEHLSLGNFDQLEDYSTLSHLQSLKRLSIEGAPMMPKSVWIKNLKFLRKLHDLECLHLMAVKIRDVAFQRSFIDLNLKWLDLWVKDEDIRIAIIESLPQLKGGLILDSAR
jgi:Leucine-rich repeat (LRR) protein